MAEIDAHKIKEFCRNLAEEIKVSYPTLDLYFIVYEDGMKSAEITKILPTLKGHPAFEKAVTLMRFKSAALEHSAFLGIAEGFEKSHLGLKRTPKNLEIFTINLGDY